MQVKRRSEADWAGRYIRVSSERYLLEVNDIRVRAMLCDMLSVHTQSASQKIFLYVWKPCSECLPRVQWEELKPKRANRGKPKTQKETKAEFWI